MLLLSTMATSIDANTSTSTHVIPDLDMMSDKAPNDEIDFDIDIEFDTIQANEDVEVQDAPIENGEQDSVEYADEIMYEEDDGTASGRIEEVEMRENMEEAEEDLHMDDTGLHEAQIEPNKLEHAEYNSQLDDEPMALEHELPRTGMGAGKAPIFSSLSVLDFTSATMAPRVTTAEKELGNVPPEAQQGGPTIEADHDLGDVKADNAPANSDSLGDKVDTSINVPETESHEEKDEIDFASDDEEDPDVIKESTLAKKGDFDKAASPNQISTAQKALDDAASEASEVPQVPDTAPGDIASNLISDDRTEHEGHDDEQQYDSFAYNALVQYEEHCMALFPPNSGDLPDQFLLPDASLAESSLAELFTACRVPLADSIASNCVLSFEVAGLKLTLTENDSDCVDLTLSQIIDVYHHLHSNDESYEPEAMRLSLIVRQKPSIRLTQLFKAAGDGKGFSSVSAGALDSNDDPTPSNEGDAEEEQAEEWNAEHNEDEQAGEWSAEHDEEYTKDWDDPGNPGNGPDDPAWQYSSQATHLEPVQDSEHQLDAPTHLVDPSVDIVEEHEISNASLLSEPNLEPTSAAEMRDPKPEAASQDQQALDADDLIGYSDDEEDVAQPSRSPTLQPDRPTVADVLTEVPEVQNTALGQESNGSVHDLPEDLDDLTREALQTVGSVEDGHFDFGHSDEQLGDRYSEGPDLVIEIGESSLVDTHATGVDDYLNLDLGLEKDASLDKSSDEPLTAVPDDTKKGESPSGKRSWDEHAADSDLTTSEHESKRTRSDG